MELMRLFNSIIPYLILSVGIIGFIKWKNIKKIVGNISHFI